MHAARTIRLLRYQNLNSNLTRKLRISASNNESSQATQPQVKEEKFSFEDLKVVERTERRKAKIQPFMKDVFVSIFNRDLLAYPEILNKEESEALDQRIAILEKVFTDPEKTKEDRRDVLRRVGMYGAPVALTDGGFAMNVTESLRYLDTIAADIELGQQISDHWIALEALKVGLDSDQYQRIVGDLIGGEKTIGLCIKEKLAERITQPDFRTTAELDGQGVWRLTGEKVCHNIGGYYLVLSALEAERLKAFLVHPNAAGISVNGPFVTFLKTPATPLESCTEQLMAQTLSVSRLHAATICRHALKQTLDNTSQFVHSRTAAGKPLAELGTIRATFGEALLTLYASESAEYFTSGLLDGYVEPDAELEVAMCRNFIAQHSIPAALELLAIGSIERPDCQQLLSNLREVVLHGETLHSLNSFIAMNGIHHASKIMANEIKAIRNPLMHPAFILKKAFANRHQEKDAPKLDLYLAEHLHPTLKPGAEQLEYCVLRMKYACETLMSRHGVDVTTAYTELNRLAEAATAILVMTAVLARASRSYCIGLRNAEVEMKLASCFVDKTKDKVKKLILDIDDGEYLNRDHFKLQFGRKVLDSRSLVVEKPTARTFW